MFTGIVEEMGKVRSCQESDDGFDLSVACAVVTEDTQLGDSIAVNGVCLTVTSLDGGFTAGLAPETLKRTNLGQLNTGSPVNLERSVTPTTRMGGHFVQGHVDNVGAINEFKKDKDALWVSIKAPEELMKFIVHKGYVTLDGTSLTVVDVGPDWFNVTLVGYTQQHIIMPGKKIGDAVNIEVDVLGKYVERLLQHTQPTPTLTAEFLKENGYD
ncbi:MAG: riboflavin synthase [Granulosicoccaceae bacterium]